MRSVLVTGANGFVGRPTCRVLLTEGWDVRGCVRSESVDSNLPCGTKKILVGNIDANSDWSGVLTGVDAVVHLAARVHVMKDSSVDPLAAFRAVNVLGTENLARAAAAAGVRRFVYISSAKVNGEGRLEPYCETDIPEPQDFYGMSKWEAEQALQQVALQTGLEVVILRPPLIYGPEVKANFLRLLRLVDGCVPLPFARLDNRRSYVFVDNFVNSIITCLVNQDAAGETFLVSDGEDVSTARLLHTIAVTMRKKNRLLSFPPQWIRLIGKFLGKSAEIDRLTGTFCVDTNKIQNLLGWKAPATFTEGILETVGWFKGQK